MKIFVLLLLCLYTYGASITRRKYISFGPEIDQAIETKCNKNSINPNAVLDFKNAVVKYHECKTIAFNFELPNPSQDHVGFCRSFLQAGFYKCVEELTTGITPCLEESENYLPHLLLYGINSTYEELCGVNGLSNANLFFNKLLNENGKCVSGQNKIWSELACLRGLVLFTNLEFGIIDFNQIDFCSDLKSFQKCVANVMGRLCDENYNDVVDLLFQPFIDQCNDV